MSPLAIAYALSVAFLSSIASGGVFYVTHEDISTVSATYFGEVYDRDVLGWQRLAEQADGRVIFLTINSPGGSAYGGIDLYWEMEKYPYLVTTTSPYGAYSAAAIMWLAGDVRYIPDGGEVAFHAAYCWWDDGSDPDIGCDTSHFQLQLVAVLDDAGLDGDLFNITLNSIQYLFGTDGWILLWPGGDWYVWDSTEGWYLDFNPAYLLGEEEVYDH